MFLLPQVVVVTSDRMGAGTDANVFIDIHGMDGSNTGRILLNNKGNDFERGQTDTFTVSGRLRTRRLPGICIPPTHCPPSVRKLPHADPSNSACHINTQRSTIVALTDGTVHPFT